jgi:hypothetical protein
MNSKAAQLRENGTEIVRLFARFALGASFLSAVADRFRANASISEENQQKWRKWRKWEVVWRGRFLGKLTGCS